MTELGHTLQVSVTDLRQTKELLWRLAEIADHAQFNDSLSAGEQIADDIREALDDYRAAIAKAKGGKEEAHAE